VFEWILSFKQEWSVFSIHTSVNFEGQRVEAEESPILFLVLVLETASAAGATSEMILTKEQLYDMFQNILGIKKYEHQILYNAMQVRATSYKLRVLSVR